MLCFLLFAAALPGLYWDKGPETAKTIEQAHIDQVYLPQSVAAVWQHALVKPAVKFTPIDLAKLTKLEKPGVARPLIVPRYDEVGRDIIAGLIRTAGISREAFFALLEKC